jgi:multisubunit Na+/H+ antiporter MnhF subunit
VNWFERYGIPGLYFVGIITGWVYAFCPQIICWEDLDTLFGLIAALIAISLPIGYVISIWGQFVYLNWRRCLYGCGRCLRGWLGFHGAAIDRVGIPSPDFPIYDEADIEARTLLLSSSWGPFNVDTHEYMRNWIARRMDVIAINQSLFWATIFAGVIAIIAFVICRLQPGPSCSTAIVILSIVSIAVILTMVLSIWVLRRQVIEVIAGIYQTYQKHYIEQL